MSVLCFQFVPWCDSIWIKKTVAKIYSCLLFYIKVNKHLTIYKSVTDGFNVYVVTDLFSDIRETSAMAYSVSDSDGVCFVPSFSGLQVQ